MGLCGMGTYASVALSQGLEDRTASVHLGLRSTGDDPDVAGFSGIRPSEDRGRHIALTGLGVSQSQRCGSFDFDVAHAEVDTLGGQVLKQSSGTKDDPCYSSVVREHGDDHFGVLHCLGHGDRFLGPKGGQGLGFARCAVVEGYGVSQS